jgi:hypothetical protein
VQEAIPYQWREGSSQILAHVGIDRIHLHDRDLVFAK